MQLTLSTPWPVGTKQPIGRPDATRRPRHMSNVRNEEAMCISFVTCKTYRVASPGWVDCFSVDAHVNFVVVGIDKALVLRIALTLVVDKSMSWVATLEKIETGEEVGRGVTVDETIG